MTTSHKDNFLSFTDVNSLKKLLPKAKGFKNVGDDDDTDDLNNPDLERLEETAERSENTVEHSESEGQGDSQNDTNLDVPSSSTTKADNQTILHFIGEKERVNTCLSECSFIVCFFPSVF